MTVYDGVMAAIVLYTVIHGYFRGAAWQAAPILSLVLGYLVALPMSVTTAHYFGPPPLNRLFALVTIYLLVSMIVYLMVRQFREGVDKAKLTEFDRHLGAILGGLKGVLLTLAVTCGLLIYFPQMREIILKSESSTLAARLIARIYPILPNAMHDLLDDYLKKLNEQLPIDMNGDGLGSPADLTPSRPARGTSTQNQRSNSSSWLESTSSTDDETPVDELPPQPVRRKQQMRSAAPLPETDPLETYQPKPQRKPVRSAQVDDPFEAANPDLVGPPR